MKATYIMITTYETVINDSVNSPTKTEPPSQVIPLIAFMWLKHYNDDDEESFIGAATYLAFLLPFFKRGSLPRELWEHFKDERHFAKTFVEAFDRVLQGVDTDSPARPRSPYGAMASLLEEVFGSGGTGFIEFRLGLLHEGLLDRIAEFIADIGEDIEELYRKRKGLIDGQFEAISLNVARILKITEQVAGGLEAALAL